MIRISGNSPIEISARRIIMAHLSLSKGAIGIGGSAVWIEFCGFCKISDRFRKSTNAGVGSAACIIGFSAGGIAFYDFGKESIFVAAALGSVSEISAIPRPGGRMPMAVSQPARASAAISDAAKEIAEFL